MTFRAAALVIVLVGIVGCYPPYYRAPCDRDAAPGTCCPLGSHELVSVNPELIICAADELPCGDAGATAGACPDAGADAD